MARFGRVLETWPLAQALPLLGKALDMDDNHPAKAMPWPTESFEVSTPRLPSLEDGTVHAKAGRFGQRRKLAIGRAKCVNVVDTAPSARFVSS